MLKQICNESIECNQMKNDSTDNEQYQFLIVYILNRCVVVV